MISRQGTRVIKMGPNTFGVQREAGAKTRWACTLRRSKKCKAYVYTINDGIVLRVNDHTH